MAASEMIERSPLHASATSSAADGSSSTLPSRKTGTPIVVNDASATRDAVSWSGIVTAVAISVGSGMAMVKKSSGAAMVRERAPAREKPRRADNHQRQ